jgi:SAM-dependent methyltransferase
MQLRELAEMYAVESTHWWYAGKRALFKRLLRERLRRAPLRILDTGCGTGAVAVDFAAHGRVFACDRSRDALAFARTRGVIDTVVSDAAEVPFADESFDLVLAFDVLEHVEADDRMLADLARVTRRDGAIAIHVPAWPSLWSRHDEVLEHKRRYTRRALRALVKGVGLDLEYLGWTSASIFVPAVGMRLVRRFLAGTDSGQDLFELPGPLNTGMYGLYRLEAEIAARSGLPFGLSLAAIATRTRQS